MAGIEKTRSIVVFRGGGLCNQPVERFPGARIHQWFNEKNNAVYNTRRISGAVRLERIANEYTGRQAVQYGERERPEP